jgi:putative phosphoribosyl transferase
MKPRPMKPRPATKEPRVPDRIHREVAIRAGDTSLDGILERPSGACGLVLFAHGSGSSRHSPRNRYVAQVLNEAKIATLLFDLLTSAEGVADEFDRHLRFDIDLLARRVVGAIDWVAEVPELRELSIGLFGASTGAAAAMVAAAARPQAVAAVVARGGRPDLAGEALIAVRAPTLLIVGGRDRPVIGMNEEAMRRMTAPVELEIIEGATHLFEETGALEQVAARAASFFGRLLARP